MLTPTTANELCDAIRAHPRVLAIAARTKPRLSAVSAAQGDVALISTLGLSGIIAYDPGEFTFTALAGTPLCEIRAALAERGQYLPFDPPFVESGATIGGTVAAGLSGPADANAALAEEIKNTWPGATILADADADSVWSGPREFAWAHADGVLAKIPIALAALAPLTAVVARLPGARGHFSAAANVAFVSLPTAEQAAPLDTELRTLGLSALVLRGIGAHARLGISHESAVAENVCAVFDPVRRFPPFE